MREVLQALKMFILLSVITGLFYPLFITGVAQLSMKEKANGSLAYIHERIIGSFLIAQKFESDRYFCARPSFVDYNPIPSGASNLGPTSKVLKESVDTRKKAIFKKYAITDESIIPVELLFTSGSGLDPHISLETAFFQVDHIAKARGIKNRDILVNQINQLKIEPRFGFIGEPIVNVLQLNLVLDALSGDK
ncbi:MAG: potassium-transporting ATPase subunit KdpC [Chlamydiales bacterium]|nr:potassium-transporting ATPase subunit KdpC [Chlamydiales bacterium]